MAQRSRKRVHLGQKYQCPLASEDDLQSKSIIKEIVFELIFTVEMTIAVNIGSILHAYCEITDFRKKGIYRSKLAVPVS